MNELTSANIDLAHEVGTHEGMLKQILLNTQVLPDLVRKVEKHETQLRFITWFGSTFVGVFVTAIITWFKVHFSPGR